MSYYGSILNDTEKCLLYMIGGDRLKAYTGIFWGKKHHE